MATSRIADSVGRVLGDRYRLTRPLGTGASAHVFVAEDVTLRRRVAIKVLHPALASDGPFLRRFRAEAQVVASLRHPNILRVYDWGEDDGAPYLVMELLEGGNLRSLLDSGALLSPGQAANIGADVARALDYAHRRGLVHRDIKPANLIFDDEGRVCVADFGLARALAEATWTEPAGAVVGTARYAAPEQARGEKLDSRADVYSLALVLVEATTGTVPFASDTTIGTLMARIERPLTAPPGCGPLTEAIDAAGRVDPAERIDAAGFAQALDAVARRLPPPAPLPATGPLLAGGFERDEIDPTEFPGRPRLFDGAEHEDPVIVTFDSDHRPVTVGPLPAGEGARVIAAPPVADPAPGDRAAGNRNGGEPAGGEAVPPGATRRRWPPRLAAGLVAVLLAGAAAGIWVWRSGALTPTHPVPDLVGLTRTRAAAEVTGLHLHLAVTASAYNPKAPAGTVISQAPTTGRLKEGRTVDVVLSDGPQPIPVPTLAGDSQGAAQQVLTGLGLKVGQVTQHTSMTVASGLVISSSPATGTLLPGQTVDLVVSSGKPQVAVPSLTGASGASFPAAQAALSAAGLAATEDDQFSNTVPKGQVISSSPAGGTTVTVGTGVTVVVSKGPDLVAVPSVSGDSVGSAAQALDAAGLAVSGVSGNPIATVTGTNPGAGTMLLRGSSVQIVTG